MKPALIGLFVLVLIGGALLFVCREFIFPDTQFAPGYTDEVFRSVKMGDAEKVVMAQLGAALGTNDCEPYVEWVYSAEKQPRFAQLGEPSGTYTTVTFKKGKVDRTDGITVTRSTLTSRTMVLDGGFLKLTRQEINALK